ncbi:MAG: hypothetical protein ACM3OC_07345 [Deltaproteobacteria bacterium]
MIKLLAALFLLASASASPAFADDVTLVFSGRTHGMIYPCTCPLDPAGGVARRATVIRRLAGRNVPFVLVDAGDSFAGGQLDQYSQNEQLDKARTAVQVAAMSAMGYDCAAVGESELGFGWEYFRKTAASAKFPFVCCNIQSPVLKPFIVKKAGTMSIGITAVSLEAVQKKMTGSSYIDPASALRGTVKELRSQGCDTVILISNLDEKDSLALVREVPGIDVLILNRPASDGPAPQGLPATVLKTAWQGRMLNEALLRYLGNKLEDIRSIEVSLSADIPDDMQMSAIVPRCFSDVQCLTPGKIAACVNPGTRQARCSFTAASKVRMFVILPKDCLTCNTASIVTGLTKAVPGLSTVILPYPGKEAEAYIKDLGIRELPAYLLGKEVEKEKAFDNLKQRLEPAGDLYRVKPEFSGIAYFPLRPRLEDRVDVFVDLFDKGADKVLAAVREFKPEVHFIAGHEGDTIGAPHGRKDVEEDLRAVCVRKIYPGMFYNYISCRAGDPESSWWNTCLQGVDPAPVTECALSMEGRKLLDENIALGRELDIQNGPTYLYENREIFGSSSSPSKEELRRVFIRK